MFSVTLLSQYPDFSIISGFIFCACALLLLFSFHLFILCFSSIARHLRRYPSFRFLFISSKFHLFSLLSLNPPAQSQTKTRRSFFELKSYQNKITPTQKTQQSPPTTPSTCASRFTIPHPEMERVLGFVLRCPQSGTVWCRIV